MKTFRIEIKINGETFKLIGECDSTVIIIKINSDYAYHKGSGGGEWHKASNFACYALLLLNRAEITQAIKEYLKMA